MTRLLRIDPVNRLDLEQGVVLLVVSWGPYLAVDLVSPTQFEAADLGERDVDIRVRLGVSLRA